MMSDMESSTSPNKNGENELDFNDSTLNVDNQETNARRKIGVVDKALYGLVGVTGSAIGISFVKTAFSTEGNSKYLEMAAGSVVAIVPVGSLLLTVNGIRKARKSVEVNAASDAQMTISAPEEKPAMTVGRRRSVKGKIV